MRGLVANTDIDWFTFLKERQPLEEVNFWQPSAGDEENPRTFRALRPGEPLFFRLKKPHYAVAGFGLFARHEVVTARLAWEAFGQRNGAADFGSMCARIEKYRRGQPVEPQRAYRVGCIMISQPVFFEPEDWVREPSGFSKNIVSGAGYDLESGEGRRIWEECVERVGAHRVPIAAEGEEQADTFADGPRFGSPQVVRPRLGQGTFRVAVTQAYQGRCAVTGEHSLPVLEAAHIKSYAAAGPHDVANGLLLRADIHKLFDGGYVTVTPENRFLVSRRLREEFDNGKAYYKRDGTLIRLPAQSDDRPDPELLRWHNEHVFEKVCAA